MTKRTSVAKRRPVSPKSRWASFHWTPAHTRWTLGVLCLTLAVLTIVGLVAPAQNPPTDWWVGLVRRVVGWGAWLAPIGLSVLGVWIIQRGARRPWKIAPAHVWGPVFLFLVGLALAHLLVGNPLAARDAGRGGGAIGYALSEVLTQWVGWTSAAVLLVLLIGVGLLVTLQVTVAEIGDAVSLLWERWRAWRDRRKARRATSRADLHMPNLPTSDPVAKRNSAVRQAASASAKSPPPQASQEATINPNLPASAPGEPPLWRLPLLDEMLIPCEETQMSERDMVEKAHIIEDTLNSLGVPVSVVEVNPGPVVTQFGLEPGYTEHRDRNGVVSRVKVKVGRIAALANDLSLALAASPIRIEAPVPGKGVVGVEVPNSETSVVGLRSVMEADEFQRVRSRLAIALGRDVSGRAVADDLAKLPHLLIAGATNSGKSVCINALIACLICRNSPDDLRMLMIDPKHVELALYSGIPHMLAPVIVEPERVVSALTWVTHEMDRRYKVFSRVGVRNLQGYNKAADANGEPHLPYIVVFIDELADLMMVAAEDVERLLCRIAQMARATGIHLVIATQRPSVDVLTGPIKANFSARIAFAVASQTDSRVVLDTHGADKLLGRGDALYMAPDSPKLARIQGCYASDLELTRLVNFWKNQMIDRPSPAADLALQDTLSGRPVQQPLWPALEPVPADDNNQDVLLEQAIDLVRSQGRASVSFLQRHMRIGYTRAARLIDTLEAQGVIGPATGTSQSRQVLPFEENKSVAVE